MQPKARITINYLLDFLENVEMTDKDIRSITDTIYTILDVEDANDNTYEEITQKITKIINK